MQVIDRFELLSRASFQKRNKNEVYLNHVPIKGNSKTPLSQKKEYLSESSNFNFDGYNLSSKDAGLEIKKIKTVPIRLTEPPDRDRLERSRESEPIANRNR
mmetsp:Transcript_1625/g.1562  ORF Transcript_1625/g.1562 Transcript_1625/m.1562 type:complete len:101 (+) Transcript_1625:792-1094(+)|eukprot:CAMPEP_0170553780 /NCGR_PEP_ID=MMETSP0211-20121228/11602_1 /TAXON_ID=311385 /ORGANISM="Pseudokeronopsis sp., Strain OXSARD2" /LENGTH=100 /DNA_ID=CAMNT_0010862327 /DNA_START=790 /DNA_END=1092 /DNA_ORIENTATION=-